MSDCEAGDEVRETLTMTGARNAHAHLHPPSLAGRLRAVVGLRCPRCLAGRVFRGFLRYNERCPNPLCNIRFEREPGYYLGAYYFSYALAIVAAAPLAIAFSIAGLPDLWLLGAVLAELLLLAPILVMVSRVMWLHFDEVFDPRDEPC